MTPIMSAWAAKANALRRRLHRAQELLAAGQSLDAFMQLSLSPDYLPPGDGPVSVSEADLSDARACAGLAAVTEVARVIASEWSAADAANCLERMLDQIDGEATDVAA